MKNKLDANNNFSHPIFFHPKNLGESLQEVAAEVIQTEKQDILNRWYHSDQDLDVFLWFDEEGHLIKQQVTLFGQVAEWNVLEGTKTGHIQQNDEETDRKMAGSELIRYDEETHKTTLNQVLEVLNHAKAIQQEVRQKVWRNYVESPSIEDVDSQIFEEIYRSQFKKTPPHKNPFWARVKRFLKWLFF